MAHHVIYVPGLGDSRAYNQDKIIKRWHKYGLQTHYFPLGWADKEAFGPKLKRLLELVNNLIKQGQTVSLVGVSAGASAVINAYALQPKVHAVVLISGKVNRPKSIGERVYKINPAFKTSVFSVQDSLKKLGPQKRSRIMSIHPIADGTVPVEDTLVKDSQELRVPVIGHRLSIIYTILFKGKKIAEFIKSMPA